MLWYTIMWIVTQHSRRGLRRQSHGAN